MLCTSIVIADLSEEEEAKLKNLSTLFWNVWESQEYHSQLSVEDKLS